MWPTSPYANQGTCFKFFQLSALHGKSSRGLKTSYQPSRLANGLLRCVLRVEFELIQSFLLEHSRHLKSSRLHKKATSLTSSRNLNKVPAPAAHCKFEIVIEGWFTSYWPWPSAADLVRGDGHDWPAFILVPRYGPIDCSTRTYNWSSTLAILNYLFGIRRSRISGCILL